jgi:hypothetical protein
MVDRACSDGIDGWDRRSAIAIKLFVFQSELNLFVGGPCPDLTQVPT